MKNYYQILGVRPGAEVEEIKSAYRKKALEASPDAGRHNGMTEAEIRHRESRLKELNEAWGVLGDPEKRREHDQELRSNRSREGGGVSTRRPASIDPFGFNDLFENAFGASSQWNDFLSGNFGLRNEFPASFFFPENDIGLLKALLLAYEARLQGEDDAAWLVRKAKSDRRKFMPDKPYKVVLNDGEVKVFRTIEDWRFSFERGEDIEVTRIGRSWEVEKIIPGRHLLGEYYLCSFAGMSRVRGMLPVSGFGNYLQAMKKMAQKLVAGAREGKEGIDVEHERMIINDYGRWNARNTRQEGEYIYPDEHRELVRKVSFVDFWSELKTVEGLVVVVKGRGVEGTRRPPESRG